ncbi:MAG: YicC family protein [Clostridiales bacterium]|nr:YicC family protein [Clostridiales bacterium]
MIQSMTGYGRSAAGAEAIQITAEIKAVNHRYCEVQIRLPKKYAPLEDRLRQHVADQLDRGKADLYIKIENNAEGLALRVDDHLAGMYHSEIRALAERLGIPMNYGVAELVALPGVINVQEQEEELEEAWVALVSPVDDALAHLLEMRKAEGGRLAADFIHRLEYLERLRQELLGAAPLVVENYRKRLFSRVEELMGQHPVDENRLVQEVAMFADRAGVDEELVRLDSHLKQFRELIDADEPVGRKLDFLCQEIHREINTTGSKANDLTMTKVVVEMKSELEKLREQVQNIR